ncbi:DUF1653 domain-containing protein [Pseudoalteromonas sp. T1lg65]|uniref:DUF1653 domain-containing protein n=1 Tax=Pseudoalteromonas sp. T1lg65 TaxID=2077101 RepID=UPI003F78E32B
MKTASNNLPVAGIYRHYKGNLYRVHHVATHSETQEKVVVYQTLYGDHSFWVRPLAMFVENVLVEGEPIPRFELVEADGKPD